MATLSGLRTLIAGKIADGDLIDPTSAQIDAQINSTIDFYESDYFYFQEATAALTTVIDDRILGGIPSDFKFQEHPNSLVLVRNDFHHTLTHLTPIEFDRIRNDISNGFPKFYTYRVDQIELSPIPSEVFTINLYYYKSYADLITGGSSNDFTTKAVRLTEYKTIADLLRDYRSDEDRAQRYDARVEIEYNQIKTDTYNRTSTGRLTTENIAAHDAGGIDHYYFRRNY